VSRGVRSARLWHRTCMGRGSSTREQKNPRVRREVGRANPSGSIVSSQESTTSSNFCSSSPTGITPSTIFHLRQPFPANFFVIHGISSLSSFSLRRSCSPREFTCYPFFLHIRNYPKVCPDSLNLSNAGDSFAGISLLTSCYLFPGPGT
jgi:hypothetical protein